MISTAALSGSRTSTPPQPPESLRSGEPRRDAGPPADEAGGPEARDGCAPAPAGGRGRRPRRRAAGLIAVALVAIAGWVAGEHSRRSTWWTIDEPAHVKASRELREGRGVVSNFEHPVLMKVLGAAGLGAAPAGTAIETVRRARRLFPVVFGALLLVTGLWVRARAGAACGAFAAGILLIEPSFRSSSGIVHTDVLLTFFLVSAAAALDRSTRGRRVSVVGLVLSGLLYGGALVSKYSALPFLAAFAGVAWLRVAAAGRSPVSRALRAGPLARAAALTAVTVVTPALATLVAVQQAVTGPTPPEALRAAIRRSIADRGFHPRTSATELLSTAAERLPRGLAAYAAGLEWVEKGSRPGGRLNYLFGEVSGDGFLLYFPVALALKMTTATVAFFGLALLAAPGLVVRALRRGRSRLVGVACARTFVPLTLGLAYFVLAMAARLNIGVRHVMPATALLVVGVLIGLRAVSPFRPRARALLLAATALLAAVEAGPAWGRETSFGNVIAGGARGLRGKLSDSNVDWGAGQGRMFERVRRGDLGRVAALTFPLWLDPDQRAQLAIDALEAPVTAERICSYDSVFVSVYVWDSLEALMRNRETHATFESLRRSYGPALAVRGCAAAVEEVGPEYLLFRVGRPAARGPSTTR
ncbi:MAG TPA: phospholipid carrier-dependent glycosyltransferase [Thermoanaerobaculia bacterium]|nr:phospholipid carrier-dependent glycosyltransferase [Thermoanaerobaculia bacterium]